MTQNPAVETEKIGGLRGMNKATKIESVKDRNRREFSKGGKCMKNSPPFHQCCCECQNLLVDYSHPWVDGKKASKIRGYICHVPYYGFTHSGWCKHSAGCELFLSKGKDQFIRPDSLIDLLNAIARLCNRHMEEKLRGN